MLPASRNYRVLLGNLYVHRQVADRRRFNLTPFNNVTILFSFVSFPFFLCTTRNTSDQRSMERRRDGNFRGTMSSGAPRGGGTIDKIRVGNNYRASQDQLIKIPERFRSVSIRQTRRGQYITRHTSLLASFLSDSINLILGDFSPDQLETKLEANNSPRDFPIPATQLLPNQSSRVSCLSPLFPFSLETSKLEFCPVSRDEFESPRTTATATRQCCRVDDSVLAPRRVPLSPRCVRMNTLRCTCAMERGT